MADPADQNAAFRDALARAEASGVWVDDDGVETPVLPAGAVEVVASDQQPVETSEVAEETPAEPEAVEVVSEAQLREQIAALEARLAEKDTFIGRQSSEVGELRDVVNELSQRVDAPRLAPQPQQPVTQADIDNDPAEAAERAFNQKDMRALALAVEEWKNIDPFSAASWRADKIWEAKERELREQFEATQNQVNTIVASSQEAAKQTETNRQWADALNAVSAEHPEFRSDSVRILEEVAPQYPNLFAALATGDTAAKTEALKALYVIDRQSKTDPETVRQQLEEAAAEATAEANTSRQLAAVVGGQTTAGRDGVTLTYEQQEIERAKTRIGGGVDIRKNWTGRTS